jgi:hypothetical protein
MATAGGRPTTSVSISSSRPGRLKSLPFTARYAFPWREDLVELPTTMGPLRTVQSAPTLQRQWIGKPAALPHKESTARNKKDNVQVIMHGPPRDFFGGKSDVVKKAYHCPIQSDYGLGFHSGDPYCTAPGPMQDDMARTVDKLRFRVRDGNTDYNEIYVTQKHIMRKGPEGVTPWRSGPPFPLS